MKTRIKYISLKAGESEEFPVSCEVINSFIEGAVSEEGGRASVIVKLTGEEGQ